MRLIVDTLGMPTEAVWRGSILLRDYGLLMTPIVLNRQSIEIHKRHPSGYCLYDSSPERPLRMILADESLHYENRSVFRHLFPDASQNGLEFVASFLRYDPTDRVSPGAAVAHPFFTESPLACPENRILLPPRPSRELSIRESAPPFSSGTASHAKPVRFAHPKRKRRRA